MKKRLLGHLLFWVILISIDVTSYIPIWRKEIGAISAVNYSWILLIFYVTYLTSVSYFDRESESVPVVRSKWLWTIVALPLLYIAGTMITDVYVLKIQDFLTVKWAYCVSRFLMIYPFVGSAILLAGFQTRAIQFKSTRNERNSLYVENNYLGEINDKLTEERDTLLKEINLLKFEAIASQSRVADLQRAYREKLNYYEDLVKRLRGDDGYDLK